MKKKHRPARPHWEIIAEKRANGKKVILTPDHASFLGCLFYRRAVRPNGAKPGQ